MRFRQYLVPLQAFFALFVCLGMAWMIFVMAGFNPTPPTTMELQLWSTQDGSYASMNSTAAALAFEMIAEYIPTPILLPVTGVTTTPTALVTATLQSAYTPPPSLTPTSIRLFSTFTFTPTRDRSSDRSTATWTVPLPSTIPPTMTPTIRPMNTATITLPPSPTRSATPTPTVSTATDEPTPVPSATAEPTQPATEPPPTEVTPITETPVEPTETPTPE